MIAQELRRPPHLQHGNPFCRFGLHGIGDRAASHRPPRGGIFPLISGDEFEALVADIREHGQRDPIKVGRGTTAAAALDLKRRVWTCDVDAPAVSAARARLGV